MKLFIFIALCCFSAQAIAQEENVKTMERMIKLDTEAVKHEIWTAQYLAGNNVAIIPLSVKRDVELNQETYEKNVDNYIEQLNKLINANGVVTANCREAKGDEVKNFIKQIQNKYNTCTEQAEKFCTDLKAELDGEFKRILDDHQEKTPNIIPECYKSTEYSPLLCVQVTSGTLKEHSVNLVKLLQAHLGKKIDEISKASDLCRNQISMNDGLEDKINEVSKDIENCI